MAMSTLLSTPSTPSTRGLKDRVLIKFWSVIPKYSKYLILNRVLIKM